MNDFTKEELDILNTALSVYEKGLYGNESPTRFTDLLKKIGQLSDNYCEQEFIFTLNDSKVHCRKCKRGLND